LEIVPLLSGVIARSCDLPLGRVSPFERSHGQEVVGQDAKPGLDPDPLQAPAAEPMQLPVLLGIGVFRPDGAGSSGWKA
jgi:hypothetical protein